MSEKTEPVIKQAREKVDALMAGHGHAEFGQGYRYWFWNLAATLTLKKLIDSRSILRRGNGKFEYDFIVK